jgi:hypothetical protein
MPDNPRVQPVGLTRVDGGLKGGIPVKVFASFPGFVGVKDNSRGKIPSLPITLGVGALRKDHAGKDATGNYLDLPLLFISLMCGLKGRRLRPHHGALIGHGGLARGKARNEHGIKPKSHLFSQKPFTDR